MKNIKRLFTTAFCFLLFLTFSTTQVNAQDELNHKPKLVVGIIVDQMRWDYLTRYNDRYCEGGFKRMMKEGYNCNRLLMNYVPTVTAVGHAAVYTGSVPAYTGIISNTMYFDGKWETPVRDWSVEPVGTVNDEGKASPHRLIPTTMTDELRLATNFRSKVISVSIKDRGSIIPGGHCANAAYWMDSKTLDMISSSYYMKELPQWVKSFNNKGLGQIYTDKTTKNKRVKGQFWDLLYSAKSYKQSTPNLNEDYYDQRTGTILKYSPYGNTFTADFAIAALEGERLGRNPENVTDFLCISFSCSDMVGHKVGPNAIWIEDLYLRLDQDFKRLFDALDREVGKGEWVAFLSADHAGSHSVEFRNEHGIPSATWAYGRVTPALNDSLKKRYNFSNDIVNRVESQNVYLNDSLINVERKASKTEIIDYLISVLLKMDNVAYAFNVKNIPSYIPEPVRTMAINGHHPKRSGDIVVIPEVGTTDDYDDGVNKNWKGIPLGTNHSMWSPEDAHIPFVIMGKNVRHAWDNHSYTVNDIAPTICALLDIEQPSACIGNAIDIREK